MNYINVAFNLTLKNLGDSQIISDTQDDQQSFFLLKKIMILMRLELKKS